MVRKCKLFCCLAARSRDGRSACSCVCEHTHLQQFLIRLVFLLARCPFFQSLLFNSEENLVALTKSGDWATLEIVLRCCDISLLRMQCGPNVMMDSVTESFINLVQCLHQRGRLTCVIFNEAHVVQTHVDGSYRCLSSPMRIKWNNFEQK